MKPKIYLACINRECPDIYKYLRDRLREIFPRNFESLVIQLDLEKFFSPEREQYNAAEIILELQNFIPADGSKIIGITNKDIFIPILTYVFGLAYLDGISGIVSIFRLKNEFYGLKNDHQLLLIRTYKEILHELGHLLGLKHCMKSWCVMYSANTIDDLDIKNDSYCDTCYMKIMEKLESDNE